MDDGPLDPGDGFGVVVLRRERVVRIARMHDSVVDVSDSATGTATAARMGLKAVKPRCGFSLRYARGFREVHRSRGLVFEVSRYGLVLGIGSIREFY